MGKGAVLNYNIRPTWEIIEEIRNGVESLFTNKNKGLSYASKMVASELIENAIKYGRSVDRQKGVGIVFECKISDDTVRIMVSNRIIAEKDYENVKRPIDRINASNNTEELYMQRLAEVMENPDVGGSKLGLYRIAYEGQFSLKYEFEDMILTIIAKRSI